MAEFIARPGDTVLGRIRETYGRLPQVEIDRLLEEFERVNQRPAGNIMANEMYILPKSTYYRDQVGKGSGLMNSLRLSLLGQPIEIKL